MRGEPGFFDIDERLERLRVLPEMEKTASIGDCQESCVRGHSRTAGGGLWQSRRT